MVNTLAVDSEAKQTIEALQIKLQETKEKLQAVEELKQSGTGLYVVVNFSKCYIEQKDKRQDNKNAWFNTDQIN